MSEVKTNTSVYYTAGAEQISDDCKICYAKSVHNSQMDSYYVKSNGLNFFDPASDKPSIEWNYTKIKGEAFQYYLEFLRTGNKNYLDKAERYI